MMEKQAQSQRDFATRLLRQAGATALSVVGLLLVLIVTAIALLNIRPVRQVLLDYGLAEINGTGTTLAVGDISGKWPSTLILEDMSLRDGKGTWLTLSHASIEWRPLALWSGELHIVSLSADGLDIARAPESGTATQEPVNSEPFTLPRLPSLPVAIRIDELQLDDAKLGKALAGSDMRFNAGGKLDWNGDDVDLDLRAERTDNVPGHIVAHVTHDDGDGRGELTLEIADGSSARPGIAAALTDDSRFNMLTAKVDGTMREGAMTGELTLQAGQAINAKLAAHGITDGRFDITLSLDASGRMIADALEPVGGEALQANARIGWDGADRLTLHEMEAKAGALVLSGDIDTAAAATEGLTDIKGSGTIAGLDKLAGADGNALLKTMDWRLSAKADTGKTQANIEEFILSAPGNQLGFSGDVALADDGVSVDGEAHGALADLTPVGALAGRPLAGSLQLDIAPVTLRADGEADAKLSLAGQNVATGDAMLDGLLSSGFTAAASLSMDGKGGYAASDIDVKSANDSFTLTGDAGITAAGTLSGNATLQMAEAGKVLADIDTRGRLKAEAKLDGTFAAPRVSLDATLEKGTLAGLDARTARLTATVAQGAEGPIAFRLDGKDGRIALDTRLTLPAEGGARLSPIDANVLGAPLHGSIAIDTQGLASGSLKGKGLALAPLTSLAGLPAAGNADIEIALTVSGNAQNASASILIPRLSVELSEPLTLEKVELRAQAKDLTGDASLDAELKTRSGGAGNTRFTEFGATANGPLDKLAFATSIKGERQLLEPEGVNLQIKGEYTGKEVTLDTLDYAVGTAQMHLVQPFTVALGETISTGKLSLDTDSSEGKGSIAAQMALKPRAASLDATLDNAPLELLTPVLPVDAARGSVSGTAKLDSGNSSARMALTFKKVRVPEANLEERPAFDATLNAEWTKRTLTLAAWAEGVSIEPFKLDASLPLIRDPQGAWPMVPEKGPLSAKLTWKGPLGSLVALANLEDQKIGGDTDISVTAGGDISAPLVSGTVDVTNGSFENISTGTVLRDMTFHMAAQSSEVFRFRMTANDGGEGRVEAEGDISLRRNATMPILVKAHFDKAHLVRQPEADAAVSGELMLEGAALPPTEKAPLSLSGKLTTDLAQYRIPQSLPASVPEIKVTEVNAPAGIVQQAEEETSVPTALDLTVEIGQPALVTGRGINALWKGSLHITGTAEDPRISGTLTSLRGTLDFAGKTFKLAKGTVTFYERTPPDPTLNIALNYKRSDFEATITVAGRASSPEIGMSSPSGLPQDEIISRILFNKQVGELSAFEAAQLATTAAELTGAGGGNLNVLGQIQQQLGLDVLRVDQGASGQTTLSAGKYIEEGIYVGVQQGALASDSSVKVEIDVTDNISVDTTVGQDASGDVGINWKWDY